MQGAVLQAFLRAGITLSIRVVPENIATKATAYRGQLA